MCGGAAGSAGTRLTLGSLQDGRNLKYIIVVFVVFVFVFEFVFVFAGW